MLLDIFFPKQCLVCNRVGDYLCKKCKKVLQPHPEICPYCHKFSSDYQTCRDCKINKNNHLEGIIIPFRYTSEIKKMILKLKYYHKTSVVDFLVERLYFACLANHSFQRQCQKILVSYVPSHWRRHYFIKGYNQSKLLAQKFADHYGFDCLAITKKPRHTKSQTMLSRNQRLNNLKKSFKINKNIQLQNYNTILLIDDITTTGATLNTLAKQIHTKYPRMKIRGLVIGRHIN